MGFALIPHNAPPQRVLVISVWLGYVLPEVVGQHVLFNLTVLEMAIAHSARPDMVVHRIVEDLALKTLIVEETSMDVVRVLTMFVNNRNVVRLANLDLTILATPLMDAPFVILQHTHLISAQKDCPAILHAK